MSISLASSNRWPSISTVTTAAGPLGHQLGEAAGARADFQHDVAIVRSAASMMTSVQIEVDEKILPMPRRGRDAHLAKPRHQKGLGLAAHEGSSRSGQESEVRRNSLAATRSSVRRRSAASTLSIAPQAAARHTSPARRFRDSPRRPRVAGPASSRASVCGISATLNRSSSRRPASGSRHRPPRNPSTPSAAASAVGAKPHRTPCGRRRRGRRPCRAPSICPVTRCPPSGIAHAQRRFQIHAVARAAAGRDWSAAASRRQPRTPSRRRRSPRRSGSSR